MRARPLTRAYAARLMGWKWPKGGASMKIRFLQATALGISLGVALVPGVFAKAQNAPANSPSGGAEAKLAGTWRGDSLCVEKGTACHDEIAVYRITAIAGKPGYVMVSGGKVVDGKEIVMGTGEGRYDSAKRTLSVELPRGLITLKADGDKLEGTFTLPDKTVLRRISLKKAE
jgi:hypothetical protein